MNNYVKDSIARAELENSEKWKEIIKTVPCLNFDKEWQVQIIPPFGGAVARFRIMKDNKQVCSVYLDWYGRLGYFDGDSPYYELYPYEDDIKRYSLSETEELICDIRQLYEEA